MDFCALLLLSEFFRLFCQLISAAILRFSERGASEGASSILTDVDLGGRFILATSPEEADDLRLALFDAECSVSVPSLLHLSPAPRFAVAAFAMLEAAMSIAKER